MLKKFFSLFLSLCIISCFTNICFNSVSCANSTHIHINSSETDYGISNTDENYCLVCDLATKINSLPSGDEIINDDSGDIIDLACENINEIDSIKFNLTDDEYYELEDIVGKNIPRYFEAVDALRSLNESVGFAVTKTFIYEDQPDRELDEEILKNNSITIEFTPVIDGNALSTNMLNLDGASDLSSGKYWEGPAKICNLDYNNGSSIVDGRLTTVYNLPAGKYKVKELNLNKPITIQGEKYYTKSVEYIYNGKKIIPGETIYLDLNSSENNISVLNTVTSANIRVSAVDVDTYENIENTDNVTIRITGNGLSYDNIFLPFESSLIAGKYQTEILTVPRRYIMPNPATFEFEIDSENGQVSCSYDWVSKGESDGDLVIKLAKTKIQIGTINTNGDYVSGTKLQILDPDNNPVYKWETVEDTTDILGLNTDTEYTLHVSEIPDNYSISVPDIKFNITNDGSVYIGDQKVENNLLLLEFKDEPRTYVSLDSTDKNGIVWLKETAGDSTQWFGLKLGTIISENSDLNDKYFYVEWISPEKMLKHPEYENLDGSIKNKIQDSRGKLFYAGIADKYGTKQDITFSADNPTLLYVKTDDNWDKEDLQSVFITTANDELIEVSYDKNITDPDNNTGYAVMSLTHFSPYFVFDKNTTHTGSNDSSNSDNIVVPDDTPNEDNTINTDSKNPSNSELDSIISDLFLTGDTQSKIIAWSATGLILLAFGALIFLKNYRKHSK